VNKINILIISNKFDFTTDYVCLELQKRNAKFIRINRDEFNKYKINFDIDLLSMNIVINDDEFYFDNKILKAVYYRAPIYLRDIYKPNLSEEEQLFRTQWTAFIRNLSIYEKVIWVNNPLSTFRAENKMFQLLYAKKIGMLYPKTIVTNNNDAEIEKNKNYIVKSLDTAVLRIDNKEAFIYSNKMKGQEIKRANLSLSPVIIQNYIEPKIDVRVTVIGNKIYAVKILKNGKGIQGDWRKEKNSLSYLPFQLPKGIKNKCIKLIKQLGLSFGAIDLIESNSNFYFIEVNPTGEWAWLVDTAGLNIYEGICDYLEGKNG